MQRNTNTRRLDPKETAKIMRKALKRAFPGVKFSLRMSRGTAWGSYSVSWVDGPTQRQVDEIVDDFAGTGFDGMTDSTVHLTQGVSTDEDGTILTSGIGYVSTSRKISNEFNARADAAVRQHFPVAARDVAHYVAHAHPADADLDTAVTPEELLTVASRNPWIRLGAQNVEPLVDAHVDFVRSLLGDD